MSGLEVMLKKRMGLSRILAALAAAGYLFTASAWSWSHPWVAQAGAFAGLLLVAAGVMGRVWSLSYLAGKKNKALVTEGPFSLCRNPLYFFSFLGVLGICLRTGMLAVPAVVMPVFAFVHLRSVRKEEARLSALFPGEYEAYARRIPRFIPSLAQFKESDTLSVNAVLFRNGIGEVSIFFLVMAFFELAETLHRTGVLPVLVWLH